MAWVPQRRARSLSPEAEPPLEPAREQAHGRRREKGREPAHERSRERLLEPADEQSRERLLEAARARVLELPVEWEPACPGEARSLAPPQHRRIATRSR